MIYNSVDEMIYAGETVIISFKDSDGRYHQSIKKFKSVEDYDNYCDTRMRQSGWKEIGTDLWKQKEIP